MNEFYLGALDLSPYIVSVYHRNHLTHWAMIQKPPFYLDVYDLLAYKRIPLFISYWGRAWAFQIYIEFVNTNSMCFTIKNPTNENLKGLARTMPMEKFQMYEELKEMA